MIPPSKFLKENFDLWFRKIWSTSLSYLKHKNLCYVFDDNKKLIKDKKFYISEINLIKQFDYIILNLGIDKKIAFYQTVKNIKKLLQLDVFINLIKILTITVTKTMENLTYKLL